MDFWEVIKKRHCVRQFQDRGVSDSLIKKILKAGTLAPSEGNLQPWYFVVIAETQRTPETQRLEKQALKKELTEAALRQEAISQAPVVIVVCIDTEIAQSKYGERGINLYSIQSTAAACENMFLAATNLGLGACWIGAFDERRVKEILNLEKRIRPVILMPVGYASEEPEKTSRKEIDKLTKWIK